MQIWNGPMASFYAAQRRALSLTVFEMRLTAYESQLLRSVFVAWAREAWVIPPSLVSSGGDDDPIFDDDTEGDDTESSASDDEHGADKDWHSFWQSLGVLAERGVQ